MDCPTRHAHLEQGKIKLVEGGKIRMMDSTMLPKDPLNKSPKDYFEVQIKSKKATQLYLNDFDDGPGILHLEN